MADTQQAAALAADEESRQAFRAWQADPGPRRLELHAAYVASIVKSSAAWDLVGPDPLLSQLAKAQEVEDRRSNADDPDDAGNEGPPDLDGVDGFGHDGYEGVDG